MEYNKKTKIGKDIITLNDKQQWDVLEFHVSRIMFVFFEDGTFACAYDDPREHKVWLQEEYGIEEDRFQNLVRGYIKPGKIVFYRSLDFDKVDEGLLDYLQTIGVAAVQFCGKGIYEVHNGLIKGEPGTEWKPAEIPFKVELNLRFNRGKHALMIRTIK